MKLTALKVKAAEPGTVKAGPNKGKPRLARYGDGRGLYLQVAPGKNGPLKSWIFRYEIDGRERFMGLGNTDQFSLSEARTRARKQRQLLADKIDPIEKRLAEDDQRRRDKVARITFAEALAKFYAEHAPDWRSEKHAKQWLQQIKNYASALNRRSVFDIDAALINESIKSKGARVTEKRVRERVRRVVKWVQDGMPKSSKHQTQHYESLPYAQIPEFMSEVRDVEGVTARALEFLILTAARSGDVLDATWSEIDLKSRTWTIPAGRHKSGCEYKIPLSARAAEVLESLPRDDSGFVFVGDRKDGGLGPNRMLKLTQEMRPVTAHGFRSSFKTWACESTSFPNYVIESAYAHSFGNQVERSYFRGDLFAKRGKIMAAWADYCASEPAEVLPLRKTA